MGKKKKRSGSKVTKADLRKQVEDPILALEAPLLTTESGPNQALDDPMATMAAHKETRSTVANSRSVMPAARESNSSKYLAHPISLHDHVEVEECSEEEDLDLEEEMEEISDSDDSTVPRPKFFKKQIGEEDDMHTIGTPKGAFSASKRALSLGKTPMSSRELEVAEFNASSVPLGMSTANGSAARAGCSSTLERTPNSGGTSPNMLGHGEESGGRRNAGVGKVSARPALGGSGSKNAAANAQAAGSSIPGTSEPSSPLASKWRDLFANNRSSEFCPKLTHFADITDAKSCTLLDIDAKNDMWKTCLVGYVAHQKEGIEAVHLASGRTLCKVNVENMTLCHHVVYLEEYIVANDFLLVNGSHILCPSHLLAVKPTISEIHVAIAERMPILFLLGIYSYKRLCCFTNAYSREYES